MTRTTLEAECKAYQAANDLAAFTNPTYVADTGWNGEYLHFEIPARLPSETLKKVVQNTLRHADLDVEKICQAVRKGDRSRQGESISLKHGALERCRIKVKYSSGKLHFFLDGSLFAANSMVECPLRPLVRLFQMILRSRSISNADFLQPSRGTSR